MRVTMGMQATFSDRPVVPGRTDAVDWLRRIEEDPWYDLNPVPLRAKCFTDALGVSQATTRTLFVARAGDREQRRMSTPLAAKLMEMKTEIESGRIVFWRERENNWNGIPYEAHRLAPNRNSARPS